MSDRRVAVVGAGPAGFYSVQGLLASDDIAGVDLFDASPAPYGLVRYGVAPDHPKTKAVSQIFRRMLLDERVRFFGNVRIGQDVEPAELRRHYDAVLYATGARRDRRLGIPGEDLRGSVGAAEFVSWYSGFPDAAQPMDLANASAAVIVGVGNVALDVARILAKDAGELAATDIPDQVLARLERSSLTDIHVIGRGGPAEAKFTKVELRELGELHNADIVVDPADLDPSRAVASDRPDALSNLKLLEEYSSRAGNGRPRRVHLHFWTRPVALIGDDHVEHVVMEVDPPAAHPAHGSVPRVWQLPAQVVVRAIGYRSDPLPGLPFDDRRAIVPNQRGRVVEDGRAQAGEYVAGWLKRGPSGVIGTNRSDARESVASLLEDLPLLPPRAVRDPHDLVALLRDGGPRVIDVQAWSRLEQHEVSLGRVRETTSVKEMALGAMLAAALAQD